MKSKDSKDRKAFLNSKHGVKRKIKTAYDKYLLDILGLGGESAEENQTFCRKKLFSFLKSSKTDAQGIAVLKKGDKTCTNITDEANLLNSQFQSVNSIRAPLDLMKLAVPISKLHKSTARPHETLSFYNVKWCNLPCKPFT